MKRIDPDDVKPKAMPLKANVPMVKSPKVPAVKDKREWREFDDFARLAEEVQHYADLALGDKMVLWEAEYALANWRGVERIFQQYTKAREFYERDDLYQVTKHSRRNLLNVSTHSQITRRVVSVQVGLLIGSFPNATPNSPEVYTRMLIEEVVAANPSASALEATCRQIRRTMRFAPTIAELLGVLRQQQETWSEHLGIGEDDIEYWREELAERVAQAKPKQLEGAKA